MALTKADMVERLFSDLGINKKDAKDLVDQFFEEIKDALAEGRSVKLSGFGNFDLRDKKQRPGRNPKTGVEAKITPRRVLTFKASPVLVAHVNGDAIIPEED